MESILTKTIIAGVFTLFLIVTGGLLKKSGEPYKVPTLIVHKLATLGVLVFLIIIVIQHAKDVDYGGLGTTLLILSGIFFIAALISGAIITKENAPKKLLIAIHKISSVLSIVMIPVIWIVCH